MATATRMQRWVSKSYQCFSSGRWSHLTSQAAISPSYESSEWAKATAYWEKTTAHSQELSSSLLEFTHKLQVHTRNLKITLLLEFKGSKLKISQASLQWYWKCRFFFPSPTEAWGIGTEGNEVQESICSVISWGEAVTAILQVSKCLARVV